MHSNLNCGGARPMANEFVKIFKGTHPSIPNGTIGKVIDRAPRMGVSQIETPSGCQHSVWTKNLISITEKEYFIKALQGDEDGKQ